MPQKKGVGISGYYYNEWAKAVKERDDYTCRSCNTCHGMIVAHHIIHFTGKGTTSDFDTANGITLCQSCHLKLHKHEFIYTESGRQSKSISRKNQLVSEETCRKISNSKRGKSIKPCSEEHKKKLSDSLKRTLALKKLKHLEEMT